MGHLYLWMRRTLCTTTGIVIPPFVLLGMYVANLPVRLKKGRYPFVCGEKTGMVRNPRAG
jgi:hypothetical protein